MSGREELVATIEQLAANAWPAPVQQQLEGWRLRAGDGASRRANSVHALGPVPLYPEWMDEVRGFYGRRGLPPRFLVSEASPPELDGMLDRSGYSVEGRSSVQIASCEEAAGRIEAASRPSNYHIVSSESVDEGWIEAFMELEGARPEKKYAYVRILLGIGPPAFFTRVLLNGQAAGIGMCVAERGWAGLYCIATSEQHRRKGVATQVLYELTRWARYAGALNLYLQVAKRNLPALTMYDKLGFRHLYSYHYRSLLANIEEE